MLKSVLFDEKSENIPQDLQTTKNENLDFFKSDLENTPQLLSQTNFTPNFTQNIEINQDTLDNGIDPVVDPIPLLQGKSFYLILELEIDFKLIWKNLRFVLNPFSHKTELHSNELDLTGAFIICFGLGFVLLLKGKVQFSYIYGISSLGSLFVYLLLNLMCQRGVEAYQTCSVLGYCLLPMIFLGLLSSFFSNSTWKLTTSLIFILWSTWSAASMFVSALEMHSQKFLVAYPLGLLYFTFALLSIF